MSITGFNRRRRELAAKQAEAEEKARREAEARAKAEAEAKAAEEAAKAAEQTANEQPQLEKALAEGEPGEPIDLEELTVKELQGIAQDYGIEGYSRMKKAELIAALEGGGADVGTAETVN